jgi:transcriptional regulator with XRE-family HTH domain
MTASAELLAEEFSRAVGAQLREVRKDRGLPVKEVAARLSNNGERVAPQTLTTWELGTRRMALVRFLELCAVLETDPIAVFSRALKQTSAFHASDSVRAMNSTSSRWLAPVIPYSRICARGRGWVSRRPRKLVRSRSCSMRTRLRTWRPVSGYLGLTCCGTSGRSDPPASPGCRAAGDSLSHNEQN